MESDFKIGRKISCFRVVKNLFGQMVDRITKQHIYIYMQNMGFKFLVNQR